MSEVMKCVAPRPLYEAGSSRGVLVRRAVHQNKPYMTSILRPEATAHPGPRAGSRAVGKLAVL
jgi:hypothetical protein